MPIDPFTIALGAASVAAVAVAIKVAAALGIAAGTSLYVATAVAAATTGVVHYQLTHADEKPFEAASRVIRSTGIACSFTISLKPEGRASHYHFELRDYSPTQLGLKFKGTEKHTLKKISEKHYFSPSQSFECIDVVDWVQSKGSAAANSNALVGRNIPLSIIETSLLDVAAAVATAYNKTSWGSGYVGWVAHSDIGGIWVWPRVTPSNDCPYKGEVNMRLHSTAVVRDILYVKMRFA